MELFDIQLLIQPTYSIIKNRFSGKGPVRSFLALIVLCQLCVPAANRCLPAPVSRHRGWCYWAAMKVGEDQTRMERGTGLVGIGIHQWIGLDRNGLDLHGYMQTCWVICDITSVCPSCLAGAYLGIREQTPLLVQMPKLPHGRQPAPC